MGMFGGDCNKTPWETEAGGRKPESEGRGVEEMPTWYWDGAVLRSKVKVRKKKKGASRRQLCHLGIVFRPVVAKVPLS